MHQTVILQIHIHIYISKWTSFYIYICLDMFICSALCIKECHFVVVVAAVFVISTYFRIFYAVVIWHIGVNNCISESFGISLYRKEMAWKNILLINFTQRKIFAHSENWLLNVQIGRKYSKFTATVDVHIPVFKKSPVSAATVHTARAAEVFKLSCGVVLCHKSIYEIVTAACRCTAPER